MAKHRPNLDSTEVTTKVRNITEDLTSDMQDFLSNLQQQENDAVCQLAIMAFPKAAIRQVTQDQNMVAIQQHDVDQEGTFGEATDTFKNNFFRRSPDSDDILNNPTLTMLKEDWSNLSLTITNEICNCPGVSVENRTHHLENNQQEQRVDITLDFRKTDNFAPIVEMLSDMATMNTQSQQNPTDKRKRLQDVQRLKSFLLKKNEEEVKKAQTAWAKRLTEPFTTTSNVLRS